MAKISRARAEALGDWRNFKGDHYHLIYTIWRLLQPDSPEIWFYQGNDLKINPPSPTASAASNFGVHTTTKQKDVWAQLKSSDGNWTVTAILEDLLPNFLLNALLSEHSNRDWQVDLISQGTVSAVTVKEFVSKPSASPDSYKKLGLVIRKAEANWNQENPNQRVNLLRVWKLAKKILLALTEMQPVNLEVLKREIELNIAYVYPYRDLTKLIKGALLGALLDDVAPGPSAARAYDDTWLNDVSPYPVKLLGQLHDDPIKICVQSVESILLQKWNSKHYATRFLLKNALDQFLSSPQRVFTLVGPSGSGKTWSITNWILNTLDGRVRLVLPGRDFDNKKTLAGLINLRLNRREFTTVRWEEGDLLEFIKNAARTIDKEAILILEDLIIPFDGSARLQRDLRQIVEDCSGWAKIVITCQTRIWDYDHPAAAIPEQEIFTLKPKPTGDDTVSFRLETLSSDEIESAVKQRFPIQSDVIIPQLLAPEFDALRIPYMLNQYFEQHQADIIQGKPLIPTAVDKLLDRRIDDILTGIADDLNLVPQLLHSSLSKLMEVYWPLRAEGPNYHATCQCVSDPPALDGKHVIDEMRHAGLIGLNLDGKVRFAEPQLETRILARWLESNINSSSMQLEAVLSQLKPGIDDALAIALVRSEVSHGA